MLGFLAAGWVGQGDGFSRRLPAVFLLGLAASGLSLVFTGILPIVRVGTGMAVCLCAVALVSYVSGLFRTLGDSRPRRAEQGLPSTRLLIHSGPAMRLVRLPLTFHLAAAALFTWAGRALWLEAPSQRGWPAHSERGLAVAAALLALLSLRAAVALLATAPRAALRGRRTTADYLTALGAAAVLGAVAVRALGAGQRPALAHFCVGLGAWILAMSFDLWPRLYLGDRRVTDGLGRSVSYRRLQWFEVGQGRRRVLRLGRADRMLVRARIVAADAEPARALLLAKGLQERS